MSALPDSVRFDEEHLRAAVLRAYHECRGKGGAARLALDAVRQLLSGAPGADHVEARYWFEEDPTASLQSFAKDLERIGPGIASRALEPLASRIEEAVCTRSGPGGREGSAEARRGESALQLHVLAASLAGPVAIHARLDETLSAGILAAAAIAVGRAGIEPLREALRAHSAPPPQGGPP